MLAVHQLRYLLAYGSRASRQLSAHGDHYVATATLAVVVPLVAELALGLARLRVARRGRAQTYTFNQCQAGKLSLPTKQDDFQINEMDFQVAADISGNIGTINVGL